MTANKKCYPDKLEVINLVECDSTNDYLKRNYERLKNKLPVLVTSDCQTAGKGRAQRTWLSSKGKGLYTSFGFDLVAREHLNLLPLAAGISVIKTLQEAAGTATIPSAWGIKWPNDVLCLEKKIAGILIENVVMENRLFCITGIGINLNHTKDDFPGQLAEKAISLKMVTAAEGNYTTADINPRLACFFFQWLKKLEHGAKGEIIATVNDYTRFLLNKTISFHYTTDKMMSGIFKGINHDGGLILENGEGNTSIYYSGEIL